MSAKARAILYRICSVLFFLGALAGTLYIGYAEGSAESAGVAEYVVIGSAIALMGLAEAFDCMGGVILHELGHAFCALLAGFKVSAVRFGKADISQKGVRFSRNAAAGESTVIPKSPRGLRGRLAFVSLGGALFNLIYGGTLLALYFVLPLHPALLFFVLFAPFQLSTGLSSLFPAELRSGRTDGEMLLGLARKAPFAEVSLALLRAQALLFRGSYRDLPHRLLFSVPVIREDEPLFAALQLMRLQYGLVARDEEEISSVVTRWNGAYAEAERDEVPKETACVLYYAYSVLIPDAERAEFYRDCIEEYENTFHFCLAGVLSREDGARDAAREAIKKEPLAGVREAEELMLKGLPEV